MSTAALNESDPMNVDPSTVNGTTEETSSSPPPPVEKEPTEADESTKADESAPATEVEEKKPIVGIIYPPPNIRGTLYV